MLLFVLNALVAGLVGLAFAGSLVATVGLITEQELSFDLFYFAGSRGVLILPLLMLAGPVLMLRALGPLEKGPPLPLRFAVPGYLIVACWCIACGHALLRLAGIASSLF